MADQAPAHGHDFTGISLAGLADDGLEGRGSDVVSRGVGVLALIDGLGVEVFGKSLLVL